MKKLVSMAVCVGLAGCAATEEIKDTTPKNTTSVLNAKFVIAGNVLPDSKGTQVVYTRGDRRRIADDHKYDSWIARKTIGNFATNDIARLDRNLIWKLDDKKKTYVECPVAGCSYNILTELSKLEGDDDYFQYDPADNQSCGSELSNYTFTVKDTGETRVLNGFNTQKYVVTWQVEYKDRQGRKDLNDIQMEFWTTTPTQDMTEAWRIHEDFQQGYISRVTDQGNPFGRFMSQQVYMALAAFTGDTDKNKAWNTRIGNEMRKIKGYPVSIKLEWFIDSNMCPEAKEAEQQAAIDYTDPAAALGKLAGGFLKKKVAQKFTPSKHEPVLRYIYEVTDVSVQAVNDSVFELPAGYKMSNRQ